jgi:hypothetical protein
VFGRRFEKELNALRKELDELQRASASPESKPVSVSTSTNGDVSPPLPKRGNSEGSVQDEDEDEDDGGLGESFVLDDGKDSDWGPTSSPELHASDDTVSEKIKEAENLEQVAAEATELAANVKEETVS